MTPTRHSTATTRDSGQGDALSDVTFTACISPQQATATRGTRRQHTCSRFHSDTARRVSTRHQPTTNGKCPTDECSLLALALAELFGHGLGRHNRVDRAEDDGPRRPRLVDYRHLCGKQPPTKVRPQNCPEWALTSARGCRPGARHAAPRVGQPRPTGAGGERLALFSTWTGTLCLVARLASSVMMTAVPGASTSEKNGDFSSPGRHTWKGRPCAPILTTVISEPMGERQGVFLQVGQALAQGSSGQPTRGRPNKVRAA